MPTKKQNLLTLLSGGKPAWTPCSINFRQWYDHHRTFNTLPEEIRGTTNNIQAMKVLGCDIFTRNIDGGVRQTEGVEIRQTQEAGLQGPRHVTEFVTPYGTLRRVKEEQKAQSTGYHVEDLVKDWSRDRKAYLWLLERRQFTWDREAYLKSAAQVGDDGIIMVRTGCTPLKNLHNDFGLDHACLFSMDYPDDAKTVCDLYWQKLWPVIQELAAAPDVHATIFMDNIDAPFYSPALCQDQWTPYVRQAADLLASRGKRVFAHACGRLHQLKDVFRDSGIHGLEGMAHPPLGDWLPGDAADVFPGFIYDGGFSAQEQVIKSDDDCRRTWDRLFADLNGYPQFIFASACQTTVTAPWERIKLAVQQCRQHGGQPGKA